MTSAPANMAMMAAVAALVMFLVLQRQFVAGLSLGATKG
jgi:ABC-type maltose transport system permease subunit